MMIRGLRIGWRVVCGIACLVPASVFAATLSFSPATETVSVGQTFSVSINVSSPDQSMNAASGDIAFPSNELRVVSISKTNSVMNLWVQDPTFTNAATGGDINFQGVSLNPGFQGASGNIITIVFRAVAAGNATLSFSDGSVLANDGNGTDILDGMDKATVAIVAAAPTQTSPPATPPAPTTSAPMLTHDTTPPAPFVISNVPDATNDPTDPQPIFAWSTTDAQSGVANYMIKIGSGNWFDAATIAVSGTVNEYQLPIQAPEQNVLLTVDAYDNAGNMREATTTFSVASIGAPTVTSYSTTITPSKPIFTVSGLVPQYLIPRATTIRIFLQQGNTVQSYSVAVGSNGSWSFNQPVALSPGQWFMHVQAADDRGAVSPDTPIAAVVVGNWVTDVIAFLASWSAILIAGIVLLGAVFAVAYLAIHHTRRLRVSLSRRLVAERKELRDDLVRIEKELAAGRGSGSIDLSAINMRRKQERVRREIEHLEEDLRRDIKEE